MPDIEMDKDHKYIKASWSNKNVKLTPELVKQFVGLPFKNEKGEIIGEVVSASINNDSIDYTIRENKKK